jgi:signal-transduction protein with cAMP-binding, CBS, and nucleotidyltransferase domain
MERFYIPVRDVMTTQTELVDGLATMRDAVNQMKERNVHALIVNKRDDKDDFGLITVNEIAREVIEPNRSLDRTAVYEFMIKPALTVEADKNIRYAIRLLSRYNETRAIVTENAHAVGFITVADMVLHYLDALDS